MVGDIQIPIASLPTVFLVFASVRVSRKNRPVILIRVIAALRI